MISSLVCNQPAVEGVVQRRGRRQARSTQSRETLFLSSKVLPALRITRAHALYVLMIFDSSFVIKPCYRISTPAWAARISED